MTQPATSSTPQVPWDAAIVAMCLVAAAIGAAHWQQRIHRTRALPSAIEPWKHVREQFPMPQAFDDRIKTSTPELQSVVKANPFSSKRREAPVLLPGKVEGAPAAAAKPVPPQFVYKGRITMGAKNRAILEELKSKKTYFLQIGQEVAGFKILDISETQVVLSNPNSQEPLTLSLTPKKGE